MPVAQEKLRALGRWIAFAPGTISAVWFAAFLYTIFKLLDAPLRPEMATGNVIPWSNHGVLHYVTGFENQFSHSLFITAPIIVVISFIGFSLYRGRRIFRPRMRR